MEPFTFLSTTKKRERNFPAAKFNDLFFNLTHLWLLKAVAVKFLRKQASLNL
jgi:hypothetical protein